MNSHIATQVRPAWQPTAIGIGLLVVATLLLYRDTAAGLVALWGQSETFAHGYVVPFIVAWLLWRQRKALAAAAPALAPAPSALLGIAAAALVWLVGDVASVNPATQFALIALIVLSVPALAGWQVTRVVLFPLAFLFFAVPFGEFLLPVLTARTADFTVLALRASGIPVYRDGFQFVIPSGSWSVVEACSGVRYLIASLMVGALFAYLNYRSTRRRVLFMLVALAVPIVANWLRAYMIVMIGHLSSNRLAVGVDHLIYGWLFFGLVIGVMFLIGSRWAEPPVEHAAPVARREGAGGPGGQRQLWAVAVAVLLLLMSPLLAQRGLTAAEDRSPPQLAVPVLAGAPVLADSGLPAWAPAFVNPSATLEQRYAAHGRAVGLYIGYYRNQGPTRKLVSSANTLVRSHDPLWVQTESGGRSVNLGEHSVAVRTARIRRPIASTDPTMLVAWQVYWVNGRLEASDVRAKAWGAWRRLLGHGDDGAVIVIHAFEQRAGDADTALEGFLREHLAAIDAQLRKTRDAD